MKSKLWCSLSLGRLCKRVDGMLKLDFMKPVAFILANQNHWWFSNTASDPNNILVNNSIFPFKSLLIFHAGVFWTHLFLLVHPVNKIWMLTLYPSWIICIRLWIGCCLFRRDLFVFEHALFWKHRWGTFHSEPPSLASIPPGRHWFGPLAYLR